MATLELKDVRKAFGALTVIPGVSMSVEDGEFVVLVGPSGCGKSTLLRMIAGLESVSGGTIAIGNRVVNDLPAKARDIAMVFQSYALYPHMTASDNMGFSLRLKGTPPAEKNERIGRASGILGLGAYLARFPRQLSGGQRQRVAMGRALVRDPQLFLFDEPLSNLDANLRVQMRAEIKELHQRLAATTIYVTHDQIEAMTMADKIVVLRDGLVEQIGPPLELYDRPANRFVGGFIGSPAMNFLSGRIGRDDGPVLVFAAGGVLRLPVDVPVREGQEVVCGLRPEDLQPAVGAAGALGGTVMVVEPTGPETMVRMRVGTDAVTAVFRERYAIRPGDEMRLQSTPGKVHLFEPSDGRRIA